MSGVISEQLAAKAREESHTNLALAEHYARLARGHLEIADDPGARWDLLRFEESARAALSQFKTVRAIMAARQKMDEGPE